MASPFAYEPVLSAKVSSALLGYSRSRQKKIVGLLFGIANVPSQLGDYSTEDGAGRKIQHLKLAGWHISFWADHAVRELRVIDVSEL